MKQVVIKGDKESLIRALKECQDSNDTEVAHIDADDALVSFIGDDEITTVYNEIAKWYA